MNMKRYYIGLEFVAAAVFVGLTVVVFAQPQETPVRAVCVPADQLGAMVGTNTPKKTVIETDDDGDVWMVLENETAGLKVIGFLSPSARMFCAIGSKGAKRGAPQRGA